MENKESFKNTYILRKETKRVAWKSGSKRNKKRELKITSTRTIDIYKD